MSNFTLRQLELFVAMADFPTLSDAAAYLHFSESALSQAITRLESSVGEQLCIRRKARGLQLTPAGEYFAVRARALLNDAENLVAEMSGAAGRLTGPVKLGCFASFAASVLPAILGGFPKIHPGVDVEVVVGTHDELLPALENGRLDLAIVYDMELPAGLQRQTIYGTELQAVLPVDHPLAQQDVVDLDQLAPEPLIMYDASPSWANTNRVFAERGLSPTVIANMPQINLVQGLVGRGLGYGLLMSRPNWAPVTIEGLPVALIPLDPPASQTNVVGIWPERLRLSPRAQALLDFTVETFRIPPR
ncbi:LysR substrate-binding domain-containing protein [Arthrobacter alpinus]|uniref:LysR family transcriptional regulator n=1 Tax=Arthrobacter alpinus TaxID=656366 RepID=A0A0S2LV74_9MICC|nr:LysR substrate-binding domain-containing protein [Arthrobacter alpinus]ALO65298.1 LysR family transcriptional regulator [Arthrobacter alpinus]MDD0859952.1 LysR substrate-binding domain-containing protein [Arthrobacter alpinus]